MANYAIVPSSEVDVYVDTQGESGHAVAHRDSLSQARETAEELGAEYHYGVEIVDTDEWTVVA